MSTDAGPKADFCLRDRGERRDGNDDTVQKSVGKCSCSNYNEGVCLWAWPREW